MVIAFTHADLRITDDDDSTGSVRGSSLHTRRSGTSQGEQVQQVLENILAEPNGLLAVAQDRNAEKQVLVGTLVKELTASLKSIEQEDSTFTQVANAIITSIAQLQKASKKYATASAGEVKAAREELATVVEQIHAQTEKLANL